MRRVRRLSEWGFILLTPALFSVPVSAGVFIAATGCDTLSTDPLRILDRFIIFDRFYTSFCATRIEPISYAGSTPVPILGYVVPSNLTCELDTLSGSATFTATPCVGPGWQYCCIPGVIVDSPNACFQATLITVDNPVRKINDICYSMPCSAATPALPDTWGRVRATYR